MRVDQSGLRNMDEAIEAIQEGTRLVEAAQGELRTLLSRVERLEAVRAGYLQNIFIKNIFKIFSGERRGGCCEGGGLCPQGSPAPPGQDLPGRPHQPALLLLARPDPRLPPQVSSHWSSSHITALSLVQSFRVMKYFPRSLAAALQQLAADPKLRLSSEEENQIARSGYILVAVTSFLGDLRDQARLFTSLCLADQGDIARLRSH